MIAKSVSLSGGRKMLAAEIGRLSTQNATFQPHTQDCMLAADTASDLLTDSDGEKSVDLPGPSFVATDLNNGNDLKSSGEHESDGCMADCEAVLGQGEDSDEIYSMMSDLDSFDEDTAADADEFLAGHNDPLDNFGLLLDSAPVDDVQAAFKVFPGNSIHADSTTDITFESVTIPRTLMDTSAQD